MKIETATIEFTSTVGGGVVAEPAGVHLDWPASLALQLINHDMRPHAIQFQETGARYDVDLGTVESPAVADYMLGISRTGTFHWRCVLECPEPAAEGYLHVAPVG